MLALYSDGLIESRDEDIDVGQDRLGATLAQPGASLEDLCSRVMESLPTQAPADDVTLLLARTRALNPPRSPPGTCRMTSPPSRPPGSWPPGSSANGGWSRS